MLRTRGAPIDQFSFLERDGHLNVVVRADATGDAMWSAEVTDGAMAMLRVPAASFIAPFAIYEADNTAEKASLNAAMKRLKGPGAVTILSLDTNHYGSAFTPDTFLACK